MDEENKLPFILAGPIVRRATTNSVYFWIAFSKEIKSIQPLIYHTFTPPIPGLNNKSYPHPTPARFPLLNKPVEMIRLGENIWIALVEAVPASGYSFPTDKVLEYDFIFTPSIDEKNKLSDWRLGLNYEPFKYPTFLIGKYNTSIVHGSCRRPGSAVITENIGVDEYSPDTLEDAFLVFDEWLSREIQMNMKRPNSLILTGDQIYADDVAEPLFNAIHTVARDIFGYTEKVPDEEYNDHIYVDYYSWEPLSLYPNTVWDKVFWSGRKVLTNLSSSKIGFVTDEGERHLLSFPEYASMYLVIWNEDLCKRYKVDDGFFLTLRNYYKYVKASRRVLANCATYMIFDDHDVTDDWNLDEEMETKTHENKLARRIVSNALAAYWCFQSWGNEPSNFDDEFKSVISEHLKQMSESYGKLILLKDNVIYEKAYRNPYVAKEGKIVEGKDIISDVPSSKRYEEILLNYHKWSFLTASNPKALCVDTRTMREYHKGKTAVLSGPKVWPEIQRILKNEHPKNKVLLIVLATPLHNHRSALFGQENAFTFPEERYEGDYELYDNNPEQRADLLNWLKIMYEPSSIVVFSGDVHHGSIVSSIYEWGTKLVRGSSLEGIKYYAPWLGTSHYRTTNGKSIPYDYELSLKLLKLASSEREYVMALDGFFVKNTTYRMPVLQITSSPIKNINKNFLQKTYHSAFFTDLGRLGEITLPEWSTMYKTLDERNEEYLVRRTRVWKLKGDLGRKTFVFRNHLCVVKMPLGGNNIVKSTFVGPKDGKLATSIAIIDLDKIK